MKVTNLKIRCLLCGWEVDMEIPALSIGGPEIYEVPDRYCAKCHMLLEQTIDGVAEKEE